jgi:hypothetical protein
VATDAAEAERYDRTGLGLGAYGIRLAGLEHARRWMQPVPAAARWLRVETVAEASADRRDSFVDAESADLGLLGGGRLLMRRGDDRVVFLFRETPRHEDLLHPYLALAAALAHLWDGHEAFHGGAFATPSGAVALLGDKDGGKSTTLAWLAREHGLGVVADDLVVIDDGAVLAGPRCLDLRAGDLVTGLDPQAVAFVRGRGRLRLALEAPPGATPLLATVVLRWGARTRLEPVPPAERPSLLFPQRMYRDRLVGDPAALLEVAALPMLLLTRPRGKPGLRDAALTLVDYFS